jgi:hypothetical protein
MKWKLLKLLAFAMALNILFSSVGFARFEHTCHSLGITSHSFTGYEFCEMESSAIDSPSNELSFKQNDCCETHADFKNLKTESSSSFEKTYISFVAVNFKIDGYNFTIQAIFISESDSVLPPSNAPPDSGRDILIKNQTFLI